VAINCSAVPEMLLSPSTCGSSPPRTATSSPPSRRSASARTCSSASTSSRSRSRHSAPAEAVHPPRPACRRREQGPGREGLGLRPEDALPEAGTRHRPGQYAVGVGVAGLARGAARPLSSLASLLTPSLAMPMPPERVAPCRSAAECPSLEKNAGKLTSRHCPRSSRLDFRGASGNRGTPSAGGRGKTDGRASACATAPDQRGHPRRRRRDAPPAG